MRDEEPGGFKIRENYLASNRFINKEQVRLRLMTEEASARDEEIKAASPEVYTIPSELACTSLRFDPRLCSNSRCFVYAAELTVPWEDTVQSV